MRHSSKLLLALTALVASAAPLSAHPHIFAEARLDVIVSDDGKTIQSLRHLWRFDDMFSSTVIVEFDKNGDRKVDQAELEAVQKTVFTSMAEYNYFQLVTANGKDVPLLPPEPFVVTFDNNQLLIMFEAKPKEPLPVAGKIDIGVYDPTFYTAIDFINDKDMALSVSPAGCTSKVVRPDPDEVIAQNQENLTEAFYNDPAGNDMTKMFATRLELTCQAGQG